MDLSDDQAQALSRILEWHQAGGSRRLTFGGFAGSGKSTLIQHVVERISEAHVCAPTGKAAMVLRHKGMEHASTVHGLIYSPTEICEACDEPVEEESVCPKCESDANVRTKFALGYGLEGRLVIVDEASMMTDDMVEDLESFEIPVLYVGDHGQLEPVGNDPGLMKDPDIRLEVIHRQAQGSPIIQFAHMVRSGGSPAAWEGSGDVEVRFGFSAKDLGDQDVILCGTNRTRVQVTRHVREQMGFSGPPREGERVMCYQNNRDMGLFNGMTATITDIRRETDDVYVLDLEDELGRRYLKIPAIKSQFLCEQRPQRFARGVAFFDFGYVMTVHKAQGSQFERVTVLEQLCRFTPSRWRYTAATRASKSLRYHLPSVHR